MEAKKFIIETKKKMLKAHEEGNDFRGSAFDFSKYRSVCAETRDYIFSLESSEREKILKELASRTPILDFWGHGACRHNDTAIIPRSYLNFEDNPGGLVIDDGYGKKVDREDKIPQDYFCLMQLFPVATEFFTRDFFEQEELPYPEVTHGYRHVIPTEFITPLGFYIGHWIDSSQNRERKVEGRLVNAVQNLGSEKHEKCSILYSVNYDRYFKIKGLNKLVCRE